MSETNGLKNIEKSEMLVLKDQIAYQDGQVVGKTLAQNGHHSITLFSFDEGEEISTHESVRDAFVTYLDGVGQVTIDGVDYELHEDESIVMPAHHPHAVFKKEIQNAVGCGVLIPCYQKRRTLSALFRYIIERQRIPPQQETSPTQICTVV